MNLAASIHALEKIAERIEADERELAHVPAESIAQLNALLTARRVMTQHAKSMRDSADRLRKLHKPAPMPAT